MAERALAIASGEAEVWISFEQVLQLTDWRKRWAYLQSSNGAIKSRPSFTKSSNGKPQREYLLSSLPPAAQLKHAQNNHRLLAGGAVSEDTALAIREAAPLFGDNPDALLAPDRSTLPDLAEPQATARYAAIAPLLEWAEKKRRGRGFALPQFRVHDGRTIIKNSDDLAKYLGAQQVPPVTSKTIWSWLRRFRSGGFAALADRVRSDQGKSRFFSEHPAAAAFAQFKYLKEGLSNARLVHAALAREYPRLEKKDAAPSYATVRAYLATLPKPLVTLAHVGPEALHARHTPFILRKAPPAMHWWIADHRVFDVRTRNTVFETLKDEQAFRIWITAIYDWGSRYLVGYCFAPTPSSNTINSALRMALTSFGFPKNFYWDNGKDFKSVRDRLDEIQTSDALRALLQKENISFGVTSALPKHPRSKPIEAYFSRWSKRFDVLWGNAYRGNRTENRPERAASADRDHKKFLDGKLPESPLPSDRQFIAAAIQWIEEYNTQTRLESLGGRTPAEVLEEQYPPDTRSSAPRRLMDVLLLKEDVYTIQSGGCVEITRLGHTMRYEPKPESLGPLFVHQGRKAVILRDPYDFTEAVAKDPETHEFIGELVLQIPLEQTPGGFRTDDQLKKAISTQRAATRACKNYIDALGHGASIYGWQTEVEGLLARSAERTGDPSDALPQSGVPGARPPKQLSPSTRPQTAPAFVSDGVGSGPDYSNVELED